MHGRCTGLKKENRLISLLCYRGRRVGSKEMSHVAKIITFLSVIRVPNIQK